MLIQWFPGHMAKAKRQMEESIKRVDSLIYVLDARAPFSCINPEFDDLIGQRPALYVINKCDLAPREEVEAWAERFRREGMRVVAISSTIGKDAPKVLAALNEINREKLERNRQKGVNYALKAMVIGMPNTGKSTLINALCRGKRTVTGDRPGVTKGEQWVRLDGGISLLDTPGTLSHSMKSERAGMCLAFIGSVRDAVVDTTELALEFIRFLFLRYPNALPERYGAEERVDALVALEQIARKRGLVRRGGDPDLDKAAAALIDDFRKCRLGKIILEKANED
ncbi:MAG: ribosome biogenesis GTPase YlqF [Clostridia bacterium]|nr:ribosome biogenesis GTPase YlqF [Clostridia bacterium]